jgi:hypothetical protein
VHKGEVAMSWKDILKSSSIQELNKILDFIKSNRSLLTRESNQPIVDGNLTEEIAEKILNDLKSGKSSPYSQIDTDNVDVMIDDGFFVDLTYPEVYIFSFQTQDYITMMKNPEKVYAFVVKFIKMIGRTPEEMNLDETAMSLKFIKEGGVHWIPKDPDSKPKKATPTGYRP